MSRLLLVLSLLAPLASRACECLWQGAFVDVVDHADLVVSGRVTAQRGNSLDLDIDQVLLGREHRERLRVWGDPVPAGGRATPGSRCRAELATFVPGSQWVLALQRIRELPPAGFNPNTPHVGHGRLDDYSLSRCGVYWLQRDGRVVSGNILRSPRWEYRSQPAPVVLHELLVDHLQGRLPRASLNEAARPRDRRHTRQLMEQTRDFLQDQ